MFHVASYWSLPEGPPKHRSPPWFHCCLIVRSQFSMVKSWSTPHLSPYFPRLTPERASPRNVCGSKLWSSETPGGRNREPFKIAHFFSWKSYGLVYGDITLPLFSRRQILRMIPPILTIMKSDVTTWGHYTQIIFQMIWIDIWGYYGQD